MNNGNSVAMTCGLAAPWAPPGDARVVQIPQGTHMEIRQLEAFAAVYAAGSVTAGARLLDRSQPMVSRQIQDLEHQLGFLLFTRTRPQVTLTEQGKQLYEEVRHVLAGLQQLESRSREIAQGAVRPLRLAATYAPASCLAPQVLALMEHTQQPAFESKMLLESMPPSRVVRAVEDGEADLGLVSLPVDLGRCQVQWSGQAPCLVALPEGHRLAGADTLAVDDIGDETIITLSNRSRLRYRMSTALLHAASAHTGSRRQLETTTSTNAVMLVRSGLGISLVDPLTALVPVSGVVFRPIDKYVPYMLGVITHRERQLSDEHRVLSETILAYCQQHVPGFVDSGSDLLPQESATAGALEADSV